MSGELLSKDPAAALPVPPDGAKSGALISKDPKAATPDFTTTVKASDAPDWLQRAGNATEDFAADLLTGVAKGGASTAINLGQLVLDSPVLGRILQAANHKLFGLTPEQQHAAFDAVRKDVQPTNTTQKVGKAVEQIGELVVPAARIEAAGVKTAAALAPTIAPVVGEFAAKVLPRAVVEGAGAAGMAKAQGGNPVVAGAIGAAAPAISQAVQNLPASLKDSAEKKVVQALGPTKERFKAIATKLAPQILRRGLGGSREALQQQAADTLETVGDQLDTALQQFGSTPISTAPITTALETAKEAFRTTNTSGAVVEFEPRAIRQLSGLQKVVADLGETATVEQLTAVRRAWDKVVSQAGGYAQRASGAIGVPLKDQSEAFAKREGASAIRDLLAKEVPDLAAINKEWSFWKNLDDVLTQTLQRTQPHGPGLIHKTAETAGQVIGGLAGSAEGPVGTIGGAVAFGNLAKLANRVFTSARWQFVSARLRNKLADAIVSGQTGRMADVLGQIGAVQTSKIPAAVASQ